MAAKKKSKKPASKKPVTKAVKPTAAKKTTKGAAKKPTKKAPAKKAAQPKKSAKKAAVKKVAKKAAKKVTKTKPAKKAVKKVVKTKPAKKAVKKVAKKSPAKAAPAKKTVKKAIKKAAEVVKKAPKAKVATKKVARKSSLISAPPPPAPKKPRFVPPPAQHVAKSASTGGGSHKAAFIEKQRQRLLDLRDTLVDSMSGMTRDTIRNAPEGSEASGSGQHQGDAGSDAYDRDFALSVLANEQDALYEIEQALRRIQLGTYGVCEISEIKIPIARLEAIPFARLTVDCQAQWEKEYGNRRFRPSDEVGFSGGKPQEDEDSVTVSLDGDDD